MFFGLLTTFYKLQVLERFPACCAGASARAPAPTTTLTTCPTSDVKRKDARGGGDGHVWSKTLSKGGINFRAEKLIGIGRNVKAEIIVYESTFGTSLSAFSGGISTIRVFVPVEGRG